ncbi:hypothetical protein H0H92_001407 [Tricholoma furcatifolium]|nr:hypothetical protein H0H92_001407 [Tricholoma furcatifolium]
MNAVTTSRSNSHSLKRKKSSDSSLSTGTAATAPEDMYGNGTIAPTTVASVDATRQFVVPRKSRLKLDDCRSSRPDKDCNGRSADLAESSSSSGSGLLKREKPSEQLVVDHGKKEKGKAVDRSTHSPTISRRLLSDVTTPSGVDRPDKYDKHAKHDYTGPLAHAEFERLKKEIDVWKKAANESKKQAKKQLKKVEELKAQVLSETMAKKDLETQLHLLKSKFEKKEECLQEWFRKAPPAPEDENVYLDELESDPDYILSRSKSCPCCRAVVRRRPIPVFVVKDIVTAITQHKTTMTAEPSVAQRGQRSSSPSEEDPWSGLFYPSDDEVEEGGDETSDEDEVYEDAIGWAMQGLQMGLERGIRNQLLQAFEDDLESESGSEGEGEGEEALDMEEGYIGRDDESVNSYDSEEYESVYVPPRWEPPSVNVDPEMYMDTSILCMLRRGCTIDMIRRFKITYSHDQGLVAHLPSLDEELTELSHIAVARHNRVFLGWNVHLDGEDYTGFLYMRHVLTDMRDNPEQWMFTERTYHPGAFDVKMLVRVEDVEHYDTSDTEDWLAHDHDW